MALADGGEVAPGIRYLGRAGIVERHGLRIAGLSGIHSPKRYELPIPARWEAYRTLLKEPTYFRKADVERLLAAPTIDILLTHDWPAGHFGPFGNPQGRALLDTLRPRLHLVGHMHRPARKRIAHNDGGETLLLALDQVGAGKGAVRLFEWDGVAIREVEAG